VICLVVKAIDTEGKTNGVCLDRLRLADDDIWHGIPSEIQRLSTIHSKLAAYPAVKLAVNGMKVRHQWRTVNITLSDEDRKLYVDDDDNYRFGDHFLDQVAPPSSTTPSVTSNPLVQKFDEMNSVLAKAVAIKEDTVKDILKYFFLPKLSKSDKDAASWCMKFEKECSNFPSLTERKKVELFKNCLEDDLQDWFDVTHQVLPADAKWDDWKIKVIKNFTDKSWLTIGHAIMFRYISGSYVDYCFKKEKLLRNLAYKFDDADILHIVASGLPLHVRGSLNQDHIKSTDDLRAKLQKFENSETKIENKYTKNSFSSKNSNFSKGPTNSNFKFNNNVKNQKPCSICAKKGYLDRLHSENSCWFKDGKDNSNQKIVNNMEFSSSSASDDPTKNSN